jgi:hypothetical protein
MRWSRRSSHEWTNRVGESPGLDRLHGERARHPHIGHPVRSTPARFQGDCRLSARARLRSGTVVSRNARHSLTLWRRRPELPMSRLIGLACLSRRLRQWIRSIRLRRGRRSSRCLGLWRERIGRSGRLDESQLRPNYRVSVIDHRRGRGLICGQPGIDPVRRLEECVEAKRQACRDAAVQAEVENERPRYAFASTLSMPRHVNGNACRSLLFLSPSRGSCPKLNFAVA